MEIINTALIDCKILLPTIHNDSRGYFLETYNQIQLNKALNCDICFVQDNTSFSTKGVLRGLHFQKPPFEQAKLVRCIEGSVIDVAVDIRRGSPTYGKHVAIELSGENKRQLFVPRGFAHGFSVLSESAVFAYKVDNTYAPAFDAGIRYDDKELNIDWGLNKAEVQLSVKDKNLSFFKDLETPFKF
jgi:dTDP-4-dehydrorhamnose 3,5-epimerase